MAVNFPQFVYEPNFAVFARPVTIIPVASQPGAPAYPGRGIFDTNETDVIGLDGAIISDQKTQLDLIIKEYPTLPIQGDLVDIPYNEDIDGGLFEVEDADDNGGGELTLTLRRIVDPKPNIVYPVGLDVGPPTFGRPHLFEVSDMIYPLSLAVGAPAFDEPSLASSIVINALGLDVDAPSFDAPDLVAA